MDNIADCAVIHYLCIKGLSPKEIQEDMMSRLKKDASFYSMVKKWEAVWFCQMEMLTFIAEKFFQRCVHRTKKGQPWTFDIFPKKQRNNVYAYLFRIGKQVTETSLSIFKLSRLLLFSKLPRKAEDCIGRSVVLKTIKDEENIYGIMKILHLRTSENI